MSDSESELDEEEANDLQNPDIVTKYRMAGDIANNAMAALLPLIVPGAKVIELCAKGDALITEATGKIFKQKGSKVEKGIGFPTCISVNNCVGHFSPLVDEDTAELAEGDVVKVDMGVHIDHYIAVVAHSVQCGATEEAPATGKAADVLMAAYYASECAQRMLKKGCKNNDITDMISKIADIYKVNAVEGVLSHQMKKHVIDGNRVIINKATVEQKVDEVELEENDVFHLDIVISTGEGKPKEKDARTTVFKRAVDQSYNLKMKASRQFFSEVNKRFATMPFTLRSIGELEEDQEKKDAAHKAGKLGVSECVKHELLHPYPVLYEKPGELVSQFKFTFLLLPSGATRITKGPGMPAAKSEFEIEDEEIKTLLAQSVDKKKNKKKSKKKKAAEGDDDEDKE